MRGGRGLFCVEERRLLRVLAAGIRMRPLPEELTRNSREDPQCTRDIDRNGPPYHLRHAFHPAR